VRGDCLLHTAAAAAAAASAAGSNITVDVRATALISNGQLDGGAHRHISRRGSSYISTDRTELSITDAIHDRQRCVREYLYVTERRSVCTVAGISRGVDNFVQTVRRGETRHG